MSESPTPLTQQLRARIAAAGPITFRDFMEAALYDPAHGYYASGRVEIGRGGDFFTNVSVGPLFGALLARQFEEMWRRLGRPAPFTIVEQGAHHGDLARDVLSALETQAPPCFAAAEYRFIEPSARQRDAQRATLGAFAQKTSWAPSLEAAEAFTGVHFSNELLDAFPVHAVVWTGVEWRERHVDCREGAFVFTEGPLSTDVLRQRLAALPPPAEPGFRAEVNVAALDWIAALAGRLTRGFVLAIDYGFSRDEFMLRPTGTLAAYSRHRREPDPLARPGEIDLTTHVDFTSLAERAAAAGLELRGFTDQHHLMVGLSRLHFADTAAPNSAQQRDLRAFQTLMHPGLMGQSFKALCLAKGVSKAEPLAGFTFAPDPSRALASAAPAVRDR